MASLTQTVVSKGIPNLLIAEGLLKILRDLVPSPLQCPPTEWSDQKIHVSIFPSEISTDLSC